MFSMGQLVPDMPVESLKGVRGRLWDYRQKSHVAVLRGGSGDPTLRQRWQEETQSRRQLWEWLNVIPLVAVDEVESTAPMLDLIDHYGRRLGTLLLKDGLTAPLFDEIEKEYLYYEARHC